MYTVHDYPTKKALKEAVSRGELVRYYQPGIFGGGEPQYGTIFVEGPHYPKPHSWYAQCEAKDGIIIKVK